MKHVSESQQFISNRYDDLNLEFTKLLSTSQKQETELELLSKCNNKIKQMKKAEIKSLDELEQYDRRHNLEMDGIPFEENEKVLDIVLHLVQKLEIGTNIRKAIYQFLIVSLIRKITRKTRTRKKKTTNYYCSLCFNREIRNSIYANRHKTKNLKFTETVYINENLTQTRKRLFWQTKLKCKELQYKYFWTQNGRIYIRQDGETVRKIIINDENDIKSLVA